MGNNVKILLIGLFFLAAAYNIQAAKKQLECWHCSSDTIGAEDFCGETFDEDNIPTDLIKERNISILRNCNSTINSEHEQAVCRKTVEEIEGKRITKRFCYYANISDQLDHCLLDATDKNVRRIYCGDCKTDKCNSATQQVATYGTILLPLILSKVFMI